jgi:hypothetical protein
MSTASATWTGFLALSLLVASSLAHSQSPVPIASFERLGYSGDWAEFEMAPEIWRMSTLNSTTYLVRHPEICGSDSGRSPKATLSSGVLDVSYESYSTSDVSATCFGEYWARFTFTQDQSSVTSATFESKAARLKGTWPER